MPDYTHLILTRFNVKVDYSPSEIGLNSEWLEHRFKLFERYCYPSVYQQTNQNFHWLVFFDIETPIPFKQKIKRYSEWENFTPIYIKDKFNVLVSREYASHYIDQGCLYLITSRLDNDDSLYKDYIEILQNTFNYQSKLFIIFPTGYVFNHAKLYRFKYPNNPFLNLIEERTSLDKHAFQTVLSQKHTEPDKTVNIKRIETKPGWLQTVHDKNVSNRVRGIRCSIKALSEFGIHDEEIPLTDSTINFWCDLIFTYIMSPFESIIQRLPKEMRLVLRRFASQITLRKHFT